MQVLPYEPSLAAQWNRFVAKSRNGTFLFHRDFMGYHADRFTDRSLVVLHRDRPIAMFPANVSSERGLLASHAGLTFGGLILGAAVTQDLCLGALEAILEHARRQGLSEIYYKAIPYIYHMSPCDEDRHALFRLGAVHCRSEVASVIALSERLPWQERRKRGLKKARRLENVVIGYSERWKDYWDVLSARLSDRYGTAPIHSLDQITALARVFPQSVRLVTADISGELHAGVVLFLSATTARCQYIASDRFARANGLLDAVFAFALDETKAHLRYFDFGTSMEPQGDTIAEGVLAFKEGFGARTVVYDHYRLPI